MIEKHDIDWFLADPQRLLQMKPFTRGGNLIAHGYEKNKVRNNSVMDVGFTSLELNPVSQDLYLTEYNPDLHHIILNRSIPHIKVCLGGFELPTNMMEITQTASFQKLIHAAHVRNLTANPLEFKLCTFEPTEEERKAFGKAKQEWLTRDLEWYKYKAISTCKKVGNCALLFTFNKDTNQYSVTNYSYEDGYQIIPNYNEYGEEIARTLAYEVDGSIVFEVYDNVYHYHITYNTQGDGKVTKEEPKKHGFSRCPLVIKRGKVAWEYSESTIEMWELMTNIAAIALKRFGTFALAFWGELDKNSLQRDSSTLIVNLSADDTNGKQDVEVLKFPEPETMDGYLKSLEEKISLFSSTSFITPKDITTSNSGGNGIALAMSNDYSLATQSALDWHKFVNEMARLHLEGLDLEEGNGTAYFTKLHMNARLVPWSLETNNTKITNLTMEGTYLSTQTMLEQMPDAAPDEAQRVIQERGALVSRNDKTADAEANKAHNIAINRNDTIEDNMTKVVNVTPTTVNS